jgi:hypothetical protein
MKKLNSEGLAGGPAADRGGRPTSAYVLCGTNDYIDLRCGAGILACKTLLYRSLLGFAVKEHCIYAYIQP